MLISITHKGAQAKQLLASAQVNENQVQTTTFAYGKVQTFVARLEADLAEVVMLMEVAPELLRREGPYTGSGHPLRQFVNARTVASSSLLALAIEQAFAATLKAADETALDLEIVLVSVETQLDNPTLNAWFRPLGWQLNVDEFALESQPHLVARDLRLRGRQPLARALAGVQTMLLALDTDRIFWLGEQEVRTRLAQAETQLAKHPHAQQILKAIASYPAMQQRYALGALFEEDDAADAIPPSSPALSPEDQKRWQEKIIQWIQESGLSKILLMDFENPEFALELAAMPQITRLGYSHVHQGQIQKLIQVAQHSPISNEDKAKFVVMRISPLLQHIDFKGYELVIIQGVQHRYPAWHREGIVGTICDHIAPNRIVWMDMGHENFENWAAGVTKHAPYSLQIQGLESSSASLQIAIFDATETN